VTAVYLRFEVVILALQTIRVLWDVTPCGVDKTVQKEYLRWKVLAYYLGTDDWADDPEYAGTTLIRFVIPVVFIINYNGVNLLSNTTMWWRYIQGVSRL